MRKIQAINYFGSQQKMVEALNDGGVNIGKSAVSQWGEIIPEVWALHLSRITKGKLKYNAVFYHN